MVSRSIALALALGLVIAAPRAKAQSEESPPGESTERAIDNTDVADEQTSIVAPPPPRAMPDYGRAPPETHPLEPLLWVPRVLFAPVHFAIEYGLREPLRWLLRTIEVERLDAFFTGDALPGVHGAERTWWLGVRLRYDHGLLASAGLSLHAHDAPDRNRLDVALELWGVDQIRATALGTVVLARDPEAIPDRLEPPPRTARDRTLLTLALTGARRTDRIFHGLGWDAPSSPRARYADALGEAELGLASRVLREAWLSVGARVGVQRFDSTAYRQEGDRPIEALASDGLFALPPGFEEGYTVVQPWVRAELDTRRERRRALVHGTGLAASVLGAWAFDAERGLEASWARVTGALELSVEALPERTVALRGLVDVVASSGDDDIPFTEQAALGGARDRLPGFLPGRLIDRSAIALGLAWRYAIWAWLDAELFVDVGNVFGAAFDDFDVERLRLSFGTAVRTPDVGGLTLMVAAGTEPFTRGTDISSGRFVLAIGAPP